MVDRLTDYDVTCGELIDTAFASYQGMDPSPQWLVFAALVHRVTLGREDASRNPLSVEGSGWVGCVGVTAHAERTGAASSRAQFATLEDGCRAAALLFQFREHQAVQVAYRSGGPAELALSLEATAVPAGVDLRGFSAQVQALVERRQGSLWRRALSLYAPLGRRTVRPARVAARPGARTI